MALKYKLNGRIIFHGNLPHQEVSRYMAESHVFCITSLSEGGTTTVVMEALQHGLPTIALDHCGFSTVINESCGIKIPISSRSQIIQHLAEQIDVLASNEELRYSLALGAQERSKIFSWDAKMEQLNRIYESAASSTSH